MLTLLSKIDWLGTSAVMVTTASRVRTLIFTILLATPAVSGATEYFVCFSASECNAGAGSGWSSGSSSNNGTSRATPWQCPADLKGHVSAGDTITVGDGTYSVSRCSDNSSVLRPTSIDGAPGSPITLRAENQYGAIFDGQETSQDSASMNRNIIFLEWNDYWVIDGFEIIRGDRGVNSYQNRPSTHIVLRNLKIHDIGFSGIYSGILDHDWTVDRNLIYDIWGDSSWDANNTCVHEHGWYANGYNLTLTNTVMHTSEGGTIITVGGFCEADGSQADPPEFSHTLWMINNTIDGDGCVVSYTEPGGDKRYNTMDFYNRTLHSGNYCATQSGFPNAIPRNFKNVLIANNLFLRGQTGTWTNGESAQSVGYQNAEGIVTPPSCLDNPWQSASCESTAKGTAGYLRFDNNVSQDNYVQNPTHQGYTDEYSSNCDQCGGIALEDQTSHDYRPTASSTALIGKGTSTNAPQVDFFGNARASGAIDIGAIQFSDPGPRPNPPTFD